MYLHSTNIIYLSDFSINFLQTQPLGLAPQSLDFEPPPALPSGANPPVPEFTALDPGQLDLYGDLYSVDGKGKTLLETEVAQVS